MPNSVTVTRYAIQREDGKYYSDSYEEDYGWCELSGQLLTWASDRNTRLKAGERFIPVRVTIELLDNQEDNIAIERCPFCNWHEVQTVSHGMLSYASHSCGYATPSFDTPEQAISAHNTIARSVRYVKALAEAGDAQAKEALGIHLDSKGKE